MDYMPMEHYIYEMIQIYSIVAFNLWVFKY